VILSQWHVMVYRRTIAMSDVAETRATDRQTSNA